MPNRRPRGAGAFGALLALALIVQAVAGAWRPVASQDATPPPAPADSIGWYDDFAADNEKLNVATTVAPISSIVRNVGGTRIDVYGIVPDGVNSHTFEPAPSDAAILSRADLVIVNGLDLEDPTIAWPRRTSRTAPRSTAWARARSPRTSTPTTSPSRRRTASRTRTSGSTSPSRCATPS